MNDPIANFTVSVIMLDYQARVLETEPELMINEVFADYEREYGPDSPQLHTAIRRGRELCRHIAYRRVAGHN